MDDICLFHIVFITKETTAYCVAVVSLSYRMCESALVFERGCFYVDAVVLDGAWHVALHAWQVLQGCEGLFLAQVDDDLMWELDVFDGAPEG